MKLHIRGGRLLDPSQGLDQRADLWIVDEHVHAILDPGDLPPQTPEQVIDATGAVVSPGFIDLHVHLREPGQIHKEDIESGTNAAVAGGFTSVCCMPNTTPSNDSVATTAEILKAAAKRGHCRVYPIGAVSVGLKGERLTPMADLKKAGCVAFSDDGRPVFDTPLLREAMAQAKALNVPIIEHCEELSLSNRPTVHAGDVAKKLGLDGIPITAETIDVARTLMLAAEVGSRVHLAHLSCEASIELVRAFRVKLPGITVEVTPHHLTLTDQAVAQFGTDAKMYPPLRTSQDVEALRRALAQDVVDVIATDHAPHSKEEKDRPFGDAPNGIVGLDTALPVLLTLVHEGVLSLSKLVEKLSTKPAQVMGLPGGSLRAGAPADIVIFKSDEERMLRRSELRSKSKNTPYDGFRGRGRVLYTLVGGREAFRA